MAAAFGPSRRANGRPTDGEGLATVRSAGRHVTALDLGPPRRHVRSAAGEVLTATREIRSATGEIRSASRQVRPASRERGPMARHLGSAAGHLGSAAPRVIAEGTGQVGHGLSGGQRPAGLP
ncbi:MAG: hypothetical protein ACRDOI_02785 [Trebonia sp.]